MKKDFCQNTFLFSIPSQLLKLSFCRTPVFKLIKYFDSSNHVFGLSQSASFGLVHVKSNIVLKVYRPWPAVLLAPF